MSRADQLLVSRGLAPTRSAAQRLIAHGAVRWRAGHDWRRPRKAGEELPESCTLEITDDAELRFVSRGGLKLETALAAASVDVHGKSCLDLGQSTGGFTDCLLRAGATRVVGVDVGHGQLHRTLRDDPRVTAFEGLNVRALVETTGSDRAADSAAGAADRFIACPAQPTPKAITRAFRAAVPPSGFQLAVADLSFISLVHALHPARALLCEGGTLLALVKPQFELGPGGVDSRGIVRDARRYRQVREHIEAAAQAAGLTPRGWHDSPISGGDGNLEFFLEATLSA